MNIHGRVKRLEQTARVSTCTLCNGEPPWFTPTYHYGEPVPKPIPDQCCPKCGKFQTMAICYKDESAIQNRRGSYTAADLRERMSA
jgi:hypothetical protein